MSRFDFQKWLMNFLLLDGSRAMTGPLEVLGRIKIKVLVTSALFQIEKTDDSVFSYMTYIEPANTMTLGNTAVPMTIQGNPLKLPYVGNFTQLADKKTVFSESTELTIDVNGEITVVGTNNIVDTFEDAVGDLLEIINGGVDGQLIIIRAANDARTITLRDSTATTGNIHCVTDIDLDEDWKSVMLMYVGSISEWIVLSRNA